MGKSILILGAGRSSASLIQYLARTCEHSAWSLKVADYSHPAAFAMTQGFKSTEAIQFDIQDKVKSVETIQSADIIVSLLPAHLHSLVAEICLEFSKHLFTASYVTNEMNSFHQRAISKGVLFLNECGLDPGIDHMSAMYLIDKIKSRGGVIHSFLSFTGGLISP